MEEANPKGSKQANLIYPRKPVEEQPDRGRIFLGGKESAMDKDFLRQNSIRAILTVASAGCVEILPKDEISHLVIEASDCTTYDIRQNFDPTYEFIDKQLQSTNVLVHCEQGISRSPTIAIAYIMKKEKRILPDVLKLVKQHRPEVQPNGAFMYFLERYSDHLKEIYKQEFEENYAFKPIKSDAPPRFFSSKLKQQQQQQEQQPQHIYQESLAQNN